MDQLINHPDWCRRVDCARTGSHRSVPVAVGAPDDLVGIQATLVQLRDGGLRLVRLTVTDDGVTTGFSVGADQARSLQRVLEELMIT